MVRIDLGCGKNKRPGLVGVDRYQFPGVDVVADMNAPLPFRRDSVDLLFASHSLEHVKDLLRTMREIYRVCKHGAQVCIVAPYSEQKLNRANPHHAGVFNEHTPRFWTDYENCPMDPQDYYHPQAPRWGLSRSDNSDPGLDIRLVRIEYFYFPKYARLPPSEQRQMRMERLDVCDQLLYHLIVWKESGNNAAKPFDDYVAEFQPYEPEYIPTLRNRGREMSAPNGSGQIENEEASPSLFVGESHAEEFAESAGSRLRAAHATSQGSAAGSWVSDPLQHQLTASEYSDNLPSQSIRLMEEVARLNHPYSAHTEPPDRRTAEVRGAAAQKEVLREKMATATHNLDAGTEHVNQLLAHSVRLTQEITRLHEHCAAQTELLSRRMTELHDAAAYNRILRDEAARNQRELDFARADLRREASSAAASQQEVASLSQRVQDLQANSESNDVLRAKLGLCRAELETTATLLALGRQTEESLAGEAVNARREMEAAVLDAARAKTLLASAKRALLCLESQVPGFTNGLRVGGFIIGRDRQIHNVPKEFGALRAYSDQRFRSTRASVVLGGDLRSMTYREYVIPFPLDRLASVTVAVRVVWPESSGRLGIEIVSSDSEILAHVHQPLIDLPANGVVTFQLPGCLTGLKEGWFLRLFVQDAEAPVSFYELSRGSVLRSNTRSYPFVLFS